MMGAIVKRMNRRKRMSKERAELLLGVGHLCYECRRTIVGGEMLTRTYTGVLPIYHHTACLFGENKTEEIKQEVLEGEIWYT